jgi:hypothetical protein
MTSKALSTNQTINNVNSGSALNILMVLCLFASGCTTTAVLKDAALYSCGTSTIYLSGWWTNAPDRSTIEIDPMGGYQFAYWVDDAGNACHGDPGVNGQTGPAVINAYKPKAVESATNQSSITEEQLKAFQEIPVSFDNYAGSGLHFVQFNNTFWRSRSDGKTFKVNSKGLISIPAVTEIGSKACIAPVAFHSVQTMFLPSQNNAASQDPNRCRVRAMPSRAAMSEEERKKYDVLGLTHGTEIFDVP